MNDNDLSMIESKLNIILPDSYKKLMLNYPFEGEKYQAIQENLIDNVDDLIDINLHYRDNGFQGKRLPDSFYIIGKNGENNIFFIVLDGKEQEIIYYVSDERKYSPKNLNKFILSRSFQKFVEQTKVLQDIYNNP